MINAFEIYDRAGPGGSNGNEIQVGSLGVSGNGTTTKTAQIVKIMMLRLRV